MYLNLHSHTQTNKFTLRNIIIGQDDELLETEENRGIFSAGIHPWFVDERNYEHQKKKLSDYCRRRSVLAVGESGMDRLKGPEFDFQRQIFIDHVELAEELKKPLIIHCVKAHSETIGVINEMKPSSAFIFHGFNNNEQIASQLLSHGCYLSLGKALAHPESNAVHALKTMDTDRLFLESDFSELPIEEIYELAANQINISADQLKELIFANWKRAGLFPPDKVYEK